MSPPASRCAQTPQPKKTFVFFCFLPEANWNKSFSIKSLFFLCLSLWPPSPTPPMVEEKKERSTGDSFLYCFVVHDTRKLRQPRCTSELSIVWKAPDTIGAGGNPPSFKRWKSIFSLTFLTLSHIVSLHHDLSLTPYSARHLNKYHLSSVLTVTDQKPRTTSRLCGLGGRWERPDQPRLLCWHRLGEAESSRVRTSLQAQNCKSTNRLLLLHKC